MTKSPRKNVPNVGIEFGAACMPSEHASDRATAPGRSQTDDEYSKRGLTYVLYAVSLILLLKVWMLRLINFRVFFALTVIWLIYKV